MKAVWLFANTAPITMFPIKIQPLNSTMFTSTSSTSLKDQTQIPDNSIKRKAMSFRARESTTIVAFKWDSFGVLDNKESVSMLISRNRTTGRLLVNYTTMYVGK
jgi:hypothetical protein